MTKGEELRRRVVELEEKDSLTTEETVELKQKQQAVKNRERDAGPRAACSHQDARLEHRFCPSCGESMPALPHKAIAEIVEEVLALHGILDEEDEVEHARRRARSAQKETEEALHSQYEAYQQAVRKQKWYQQMDAEFRSFEEFRKAEPAARRAELKKLGVAEPWIPKSSAKGMSVRDQR